MKSNRELKELAWGRLWKGQWFWKLLGGGLLLGLCQQVAQSALANLLGGLNVRDWFVYLEAVAKNRQDLTTPVPNLTRDFIVQATSATVLELFVYAILFGIVSYGLAKILLRCLRNESENWLPAAFTGFKSPFGMFAMTVRYFLVMFGWMVPGLVAVGVSVGGAMILLDRFANGQEVLGTVLSTLVLALGILVLVLAIAVPFYRYRFVWLVKAEDPTRSSGECFRLCRERMRGKILGSFRLDCSYWKPIAGLLLLVLAMGVAIRLLAGVSSAFAGLGAVGLLLTFLLLVYLPCAVVLTQYIHLGQGFYYKELTEGV